ncbi:MAG: glycoside hydrolase, partial [Magnetospirillum sp.]|nr:glycoside hydrolase [Magnetospirillum sp.]
MSRPLLMLAAALTLLAGTATAQHSHTPETHKPGAKAPAICTEPAMACATAITPFAAADGGLWLAWSAGGQVSVARSGDGGASFAPAITVSDRPATVDDNGEGRPKVFADTAGRVFVTWTTRQDKGYTGNVWLARSTDGGQSFAPAKLLSDDPTSQRFETLGITADGKIVVLWIDKRGITAAKAAGKPYAGAALVATWSEDGGASFGPGRIVADHSCECCRLGLATAPDGGLIVTWRQIFAGGIRDHAAATIGPHGLGPIRRIAEDNWKVDGCPHHGPALAVDQSGAWQVAWFTDGSARQGLFHARSTDNGASFSEPRALGNPDNQPSHPQLLALGGTIWLAWKEFDGERATIQAQFSTDNGATWSPPQAIAATHDASDHPQLVAVAGQARL